MLRRAPAFVLFVGLAARVLVLFGAESYRFDPADDHWEAGYETGQIAWHLAEGRGFSLDLSLLESTPPAPTAWLSPGYPLIVAGFFFLFGSFSTTSLVLVLLFQALIGALAAAALCVLGRAAGASTAGLAAGLALALWPTAVARDVAVIWGTTLFILLAVGLAILALRMRRSGGFPTAAAAGAVAGWLLLTEPVGALFVAALFGWVWLGRRRRERRRALAEVAVAAGVTVLLLVPWIVRNQLLFDRFVPFSSSFGYELFIGNHPGSDGSYVRIDSAIRLLAPEALDALGEANEAERSTILGREALRHIRSDPRHFLLTTARRVWLFWRVPSYGEWERMGIGGWVGRVSGRLYEAGHLLILLCAAGGVILALRKKPELAPASLFLLTYPLGYYVTHVGLGRYRAPVFPFLLLLAAYAVVAGLSRLGAGTGLEDQEAGNTSSDGKTMRTGMRLRTSLLTALTIAFVLTAAVAAGPAAAQQPLPQPRADEPAVEPYPAPIFTLDGRAGIAVPTGNFDDMVQAGPAIGGGIGYWIDERVGLRVDGDLESFVARGDVAAGAAPDVRLWTLTGGVQVRWVDPARASGWTTTLGAGAGATRFDSDDFTVGDAVQELDRTYFSSYARVNVDYRAVEWLGVFADVSTRLVLTDREDMRIWEAVAPGEVEAFSAIWAFPFTVGARLIF